MLLFPFFLVKSVSTLTLLCQWSFSSSNRDFHNDKIIQPFALSDFRQTSSLLRLLLTSCSPDLYHYKFLVQINKTSPVKIRILSLHLSAIYTSYRLCVAFGLQLLSQPY